MSFIALFALLGLFLAGLREGVWRQYTPEDVARWRAETAANAPLPRPGLSLPASAPLTRPEPAIVPQPKPKTERRPIQEAA